MDYRPSGQNARNYAFVMRLVPSAQVIVDSILLLSLGFLTYYSFVYYTYKTAPLYYSAIVANWLLSVLLFQFAGLYNYHNVLSPRRSLDVLVIAIVTVFLLLTAAAFSLKISSEISRVWFAILFFASVSSTVLSRLALSFTVQKLAEKRIISRRIAIFGNTPQIEHVIRHFQASRNAIISIDAIFVASGASASPTATFASKGGLDELIAAVRADQIDDIVLAMSWSDSETVKQVVERLRELPTNVMLSADIVGYELPTAAPPGYFDPTHIFQLIGKPLSGWDVVLKTSFDYILAAVLLVALSPLFVVVALLIKASSPGPVYFRQRRLGFNNRQFDIFKFRSMSMAQIDSGKTLQARPGDRRITWIGRILRKSSIDELPQLFNVLNGTMSLVGPRPHAVDHNEDYAKRIRGYFSRHRAKPGITGLAQIRGFRGLTDTDEKMDQRVRSDIEYIENWTPLLDFKILLLTPAAVISGKNAE